MVLDRFMEIMFSILTVDSGLVKLQPSLTVYPTMPHELKQQ